MEKSLIESQENSRKSKLSDTVFRPMLFSTPMVRSILDGKKTQTRRIIKLPKNSPKFPNINNPDWDWEFTEIGDKPFSRFKYIYERLNNGNRKAVFHDVNYKINIGDIIWGRETFAVKGNRIFYKADNDDFENAGLKGLYDFVWKPSLFMPKNVCRLFLEVEDVRVQRLQDISEEDAIAEGLETSIVKSKIFGTYIVYKNYYVQDAEDQLYYRSPIDSYKSLWMSINGAESWQENPFVWAYTFKVVECPKGFV